MAGTAAAAAAGCQQEKKRKRQPSRKGKKAWRLNIDIGDIEEGLKESREEERTGAITGLPDSSLYVLDDAENPQLYKRARKALRTDEILNARSAVPAFTSRPRVNKLPKGADATKPKPQMSKNTQLAVAKLVKSGVVANGKSQVGDLTRTKKQVPNFDLWAPGDSKVEGEKRTDCEFIAAAMKVPVKLPKSMQIKPARLAAVENVQAGASYQAPESERSKLIELAGITEIKKEKEEAELSELRVKLMKARSSARAEDMLLASDEEMDSGKEGERSAERKEPKRKTGAQRRRAARQKQLEREAAARKASRKMNSLLDSLKKLSKHFEKNDAAKAEETKRVELRRLREAMPKQKLGKYHVPDAPLDVQLDDELADSLRALKPEGNLFRDRFVGFQRRNLIEPRVRVKRTRRYRLKEYEAYSYRIWQEMNQ